MIARENRLCIYTVKKVLEVNKKKYTYGGFGDYLTYMAKSFKSVNLVSQVKKANEVPQGWYEIKESNIDYIWLPHMKTELDVWINMIPNFLRCYKAAYDCDLVHARMPDWTGILGAISANLRNKKCFISIIADWKIEAERTSIFKKFGLGLPLKIHYYFYDFWERMLSRKKLVFAQGLTPYLKHKNSSKCFFVYSSAHYKKDILLEKRKKTFTKKILTVGRLTGIKNQSILIKSLQHLNTIDNGWTLEIVGSGPKLSDLKDEAIKLGVHENITFHGMVSKGEKLWSIYDNNDLFILPSLSEGTPKVILEAMARGLIVMSSNIENLAHTLNNDSALLFDCNNHIDIANKIVNIAKHPNRFSDYEHKNISFSKKTTVEAQNMFLISKVEELM